MTIHRYWKSLHEYSYNSDCSESRRSSNFCLVTRSSRADLLTVVSDNHPQEAIRLREALEKLAMNPQTAEVDVKKLQPVHEGVFRLRVGGYRLLFTFDKTARMLRAQSADDRKDAYR